MPNIKLQASDGEILDTDLQTAKRIGIIKTMLETCRMKIDDNTIVPLPNVNSVILRKVLEWAEHHKDDPELIESVENIPRRNDNLPNWDDNFLKINKNILTDLISAANYLDVKDLLKSGCKTVANMFKGKTPKEIRETFGIVDDLSEGPEGN